MNDSPSLSTQINNTLTASVDSKGAVLIVDDKPDNLRLLSTILTNEGFEVRKALSGQMALMAVEAAQPDVILLDVNMPEMDGYEVCQILKTQPQTQEIPIIFISALNDVLDKVKAFSVGGVDYITKPFQGPEVIARVENHLAMRRLSQQLKTQNERLQQEIRDRFLAETALLESEKRLRKQNSVLINLSRNKALYRGNLEAAIHEITEAAALTLDIERASVWLFNETHSAIQCLDLFKRTINQHSQGLELAAQDYPAYFKAVKEDWIIAANDARTDPRTCDFTASYLVPLGITSMLDTPIRLGGNTVGVLCLEQVGTRRHWTVEEQNFASSLADLASLAVEARDRRRLQAEIAQKQRFLDSIIENIPLAIFAKDVADDFRFVLWNKTSEEMFGHSRAEALGHSVHELYPLEQANFFAHKDVEVVETGKLIEIPEEPIDTKWGKTRWLRTLKVPLIDHRDRVTHLLCISEDITERKRSEAALRQAEEKYRSIFENATEGIFQITPTGRYLSANLALARIYGYSDPKELVEKITEIPNQVYVDPQRWPTFVEMLAQHDSLANFESQVYRQDGSIIWISENVRSVFSPEGQLLYYEGIVTDVTRRKLAEDALRQSEKRLRNQNQVLLKLNKNKAIGQGNLALALKAITKAASLILGVGRVSVWLYDETASQMKCANLFERHRRLHSSGAELTIQDYPHYFKALQNSGSIAAENTLTDPRLQELREQYFRPLNILSSLDVRISQSGKNLGVICLEQVGKHHSWTPEEESFARSIADLVALAIESQERKRAEEALRQEQAKSEELLLNILPAAIANSLKEEQRPIAEHFNEVTILFADIVGFTPLSAKMPPIQLVSLLNEIFSQFDALAEHHGLEKIKTIGDAYMVVGGLPVPTQDHAKSVAQMAIDMQAAIQCFEIEKGEQFPMRIGINSGPVVAGVIGKKKFIYDLWGDAVNVASRMESSGLPGTIHVTEIIYEQLKHQYWFEKRGAIAVKGKGEMTTYWLKGAKNFNLSQIAIA